MARKAKVKLPPPPVLPHEDKALIILDVTREQLDEAACISNVLAKSGIESRVWEYLAGSPDPVARKMAKLRAGLSVKQAEACPIEAICIAAGVDTPKALGIIMEAVFVQAGQTSQLLAAAAHRDVVQATIEMAQEPGGTQERKMLLQHAGFLPMPKNQIINVHGAHASVVGGNQQNVAILPPVEDGIKRLNDRFSERFNDSARLLDEPRDMIEAEVVPSDDDSDDED